MNFNMNRNITGMYCDRNNNARVDKLRYHPDLNYTTTN